MVLSPLPPFPAEPHPLTVPHIPPHSPQHPRPAPSPFTILLSPIAHRGAAIKPAPLTGSRRDSPLMTTSTPPAPPSLAPQCMSQCSGVVVVAGFSWVLGLPESCEGHPGTSGAGRGVTAWVFMG
ncbi:hypothetical protein E2C01_100168 [Portunus trituberculatus]|uniref:Uncharacterized protein n=1 Tax=Portunus trituberculatus TaxID=210409 RepID=A0A5B7KGQ1_PORTR|nr:hypothetical protein [Portunus trituberculatus]